MHSPIEKRKKKDKHQDRSKCFVLDSFSHVQAKKKWHPLKLQKVFRQVKLSFEDLISILLLFLQAAVPCSAGKPLAMRFLVGADKHQLPEEPLWAGLWLQGCQELQRGCPGLLS